MEWPHVQGLLTTETCGESLHPTAFSIPPSSAEKWQRLISHISGVELVPSFKGTVQLVRLEVASTVTPLITILMEKTVFWLL